MLDPGIPADSEYERAALAEAARARVPVIAGAGRAGLQPRRLRVRVLWPAEDAPPGGDPNKHAIVLVASYGRIDALLTADAEAT